jgi:hypothetical protein
MTMRTRNRAVLAALPLALMLALTGCDSDNGGNDNDVASANDGNQDDGNQDDGGESASPPSEDELYQMQLEYVECLREHGLDVDDPQPGEGVQLQIDGDPATAEAAMEACEDLMPPPPEGGQDEAEVREDMLEYAQCMRDNGVEEFEDPQPDEGIDIGPQVAEDPDFETAQETCDEVFGGDGERAESSA